MAEPSIAKPSIAEAEHRAAVMVAIDVDIDPGLAGAEELGRWITEDAEGVVAALPADSSYRGVVRITVGGSLYDFQIELAGHRDGEELARLEPWSCECSYQELRAACRQKLPRVVDALKVVNTPGSSAESGASDESGGAEYEAEPAAIGRAQQERRATRIGPARIAGITLLTTGVAGLATGVSFLAVGRTEESVGGSMIRGRDFGPSGILVAGVGGGLLLSGTIILLLSRRIDQRRSVARANRAMWSYHPRF